VNRFEHRTTTTQFRAYNEIPLRQLLVLLFLVADTDPEGFIAPVHDKNLACNWQLIPEIGQSTDSVLFNASDGNGTKCLNEWTSEIIS
jgi:hypothetical protein